MIEKDTGVERPATSAHELCGWWSSFHWQLLFEDYPAPSRGMTRLCARAHGDHT